MELSQVRARYHHLQDYAHRRKEYSHEQDLWEIIAILESSDNKDEVIRFFQSKIASIHPLDVWYLVNFEVALNDLLTPHRATAISTTDRAILECLGSGTSVWFVETGMLFPKGTICSSGLVSMTRETTQIHWRLLLPCLVEVAVIQTLEEGGEATLSPYAVKLSLSGNEAIEAIPRNQLAAQKISIPREGYFFFKRCINTTPLFLKKYDELASSPGKQNWSSLYSDFPTGLLLQIAE